MNRRYVNEFGHQETIDQVFVASDKQLRPNRNGNLYLQVDLSDRSGSIGARMWNASESVYRAFENGDYVRVEGTTQLFQGAVQLIATRLTKVDPAEVNADDFLPLRAVEVDKLVMRLGEILRGLTDPSLHTLAECFLLDEGFMAKFTRRRRASRTITPIRAACWSTSSISWRLCCGSARVIHRSTAICS